MPSTDYQLGIDDDAKRAFEIFAGNLKQARKARGWTIQEAASRALLSVNAYRAAEAGNLGTAAGVYLAALNAMGLADAVADLATPHRDDIGRQIQQANAKLRGR